MMIKKPNTDMNNEWTAFTKKKERKKVILGTKTCSIKEKQREGHG